jgi:hypothetical protein
MAKMIPPYYNVELTKSKAEKKLFEMLKSCPPDWIVFHSFDVSHSFEKEIHKKKRKSEIDFLVLVPNHGIAAFEVKGGNIRIGNNTNIWYSNNKEIENPFKQIEDNIHILKNKYEKRYGKGSFPYFDHGVMFPDCPFSIDKEFSYEQWKIFDQRNIQNIISFITSFLKTSRQLWEEKYHVKIGVPTEYELNAFANKIITNKKDIEYADWKKIIEYSQKIFSEEQLQTLYNITRVYNRCLIEGYTGTGKTIIAIETAKDSLEKGKHIAFFCFNSILADWLKKQLPKLDEHSFVGSFHKFLEERIKISGLEHLLVMPNSEKNYIDEIRKINQNLNTGEKFPEPVVGNDDFFEVTIPNIALDALKKFPVKYDKVIIDEAQDIFVDNYIHVLNEILRDGIKKGKWCFFADPEQNIEKSKNKKPYNEVIKSLGEAGDDFSRPPPLTTNWRNSKNIYNDILKLTNLTNYHNISNKNEEGQIVKYYQWSTLGEQKEKIEKCLDNLLKNENIGRKDITLLTTYDPHRNKNPSYYEKSVLSTIDKNNYGLNEYKEGGTGITYSSIASFKGMENDVIILVDVESYTDKNLLYVGMSRARVRLIVFESKQAEEERNKFWV